MKTRLFAGTVLKNIIYIFSMVFLGACNHSFSYVSRNDLKEIASTNSRVKDAMYDGRKALQLGGIYYSRYNEGEKIDRYIILKRKKGFFSAETLLSKTERRKTFMSLGINSRLQEANFQIRVEF